MGSDRKALPAAETAQRCIQRFAGSFNFHAIGPLKLAFGNKGQISELRRVFLADLADATL